MVDATDALRVQLLAWIAERPRTYREVMDAWRTSCPRLPIWEDAVDDALVEVKASGTLNEARVVVTDRGAALLQLSSAAA